MISTELARRHIHDVGIDLVSASCVGHRFRPHFHADLALAVVSSGRHRLRCESGSYLVGAGDMVVVNPGEIHSDESVDALSWGYSMFYIPGRLMRDLAPAAGGGSSESPWFPASVIRDPPFAHRLASLHRQVRDGFDAEPRARLAAALREFAARHGVRRHPPVETRSDQPHQRARRYLEEHWASPIHLTDLSRVSGVSVFHLAHSFKQAIGIPPGAYLRQIRIARAQGMLRMGRPVAEVARATAFSDQSHFTRRFKETLGFPPGAYLRAVLVKAAGWIGAPRDPTR